MPNDPTERAIPGLTQQLDENFTPGRNYLFAVGINAYQNFQHLKNARKDIEDLEEILVQDYNFQKENIYTLCDADATKANIIDELEKLRTKIGEKDSLLIYYSGHGWMQKDTERGFWIPVDATKERVSSYIANAELKDIIAAIQAHHILLISDSCFSGSLLTRAVSGVRGDAFKDWIRYPSRWAFVSGKGPVSDGEIGENSPFAEGIINQLKQNDGVAINIVRLADQVTQVVRFKNNQLAELSPLDMTGHEGGQFVFIRKQAEKEVWESALARNTEGSYGAYLDKYPGGKYEKEANQKLIDLADDKEWSKTMRLDAAFAYRQYKQKYPLGIHSKEAESKIEAFEVEDPQIQQSNQGKIVHNVPPKMQVGKVITCMVKIAGKEEYFLKDPDYQVNKFSTTERLDISGNMKVEIRGDENIKVEAINDPEQLVDDHSPTTWLFKITPLTIGAHGLNLLAYTLYDNDKKKNTKYYTKMIEVVAEPQPVNKEFYEYSEGNHFNEAEKIIETEKSLRSVHSKGPNENQIPEKSSDQVSVHKPFKVAIPVLITVCLIAAGLIIWFFISHG
jgi:Caspase domain